MSRKVIRVEESTHKTLILYSSELKLSISETIDYLLEEKKSQTTQQNFAIDLKKHLDEIRYEIQLNSELNETLKKLIKGE